MVAYNELIFEETSNPDPITGEPGAHPVATGIGAAAAGAVATALGATSGPIGALLGAVVGSIAGGLMGKGAAEATNPTVVSRRLARNASVQTASTQPASDSRSGQIDHSYVAYQLAYQVGYEQYGRTDQPTSYQEAEPELRREYERRNDGSYLPWEEVHYVVKDAWERAKRNDFFAQEDLYWREHYYLQPYADPELPYEAYQSAYRVGYECFAELGEADHRGYEEIERDLHRRYEAEYVASGLEWAIAKHAIRDAWYRATKIFVNQ